MFEFVFSHWLYFLGAALLLGFIGRRISIAYSSSVLRELEEYAVPAAQPQTPPPPPHSPATFTEHRNKILKINDTSGRTPVQLVQDLTTALAGMQVTFRFYRAHTLIFLSQLNFLRALNNATARTTNKAEAEKFFEIQVSQCEGLKGAKFIDWAVFLTDEGLIAVEADTIKLTSTGQEFLVWCINNQKRDPPAGT